MPRSLNLGDVVLPTLEVMLAWLVVATLLAGCGYLARRVLLALFAEQTVERLAIADVWIGLAVVVAYLQIWNLFRPVDWTALPVPAVLGLAGAAYGGWRSRASGQRALFSPWGLLLLGVGTLWVANRALAASTDYDQGLYHLGAIGYALKYPAIPGLGDLHFRLAAGNAHLLFVAALDHGPLAGAGPRVANGLLVAMLFAELGSRLSLGRAPRWPSTLTGRMALLLLPATILAAGLRPTQRLSSPNLDLVGFVTVAVGILYLAETVESGFRPVAALTALAALATASVTRPLYWITALLALAIVGLSAAHGRRRPWQRGLLALVLAGVIPGALLLGWAGRQAVLSGYPLYPLTIGRLPVDWRMPGSLVHVVVDSIRSFARWQGAPPRNASGGLGEWLPHWLHVAVGNLDVIGPLLFLACLIPALVCRGPRDIAERRQRRVALLAVVVPVVVTGIAWFLTAPDPRFGLALLWLAPIALAAWALPGTARGAARPARVLAYATLVAASGFLIAKVAIGGAFDPVTANHGGPLGAPANPIPRVIHFSTRSGLVLEEPSAGDRCWQVLLCTPYPNPRLQLRGSTIRQGFRLAP